jgi:predicted ribosomally synthesized peptide with SipW-like signal peptide
MNKKILASIFVIGMLALAMGYGTYSYFSDTERSSGNVFQAGILDMQLVSNPVDIRGLKPGDTATLEFMLRNINTITIKYLLMRDENLDWGGDGYLGYVIEIVNIKEYKIDPDGSTITYGPETCSGSTYEGWLPAAVCDGGVYDNHLSLNEFFTGFPSGTHGANDYWDVVTLSANWGGGDLPQWYYYKMVLELKFMETNHPQDAYQGAWIQFDWVIMGTHADKTQIEGYVP